jgi:DNA-binding MarR family transcriptional regulator
VSNDHPDAHDAHQSASTLLLEAVSQLREAEYMLRNRMRTTMALGGNEVLAIEYIARAEAGGRTSRPRELAALLGVTAAAATIIIDRLVRRGLATRSRDPEDRRARLIALTEVAHSRLDEAYGTLPSGIRGLVGELADRDSARITKLARDLRSLLDAASPLP